MDGGRLVVESECVGGRQLGWVGDRCGDKYKNSVSLSLSLRQPLPLPRPRPLQILAELSVLCAQCTVWGAFFILAFFCRSLFLYTHPPWVVKGSTCACCGVFEPS